MHEQVHSPYKNTLLIQVTEQNHIQIIVIEGNGYETCQSSLLYVIVLIFSADPAQNTIVVYSELRN